MRVFFFLRSHLKETIPFDTFALFVGYVFVGKMLSSSCFPTKVAPSLVTTILMRFARLLPRFSIRRKLCSSGTTLIPKFQVSDLRLHSLRSRCLQRKQCSQYGQGLLRFHKFSNCIICPRYSRSAEKPYSLRSLRALDIWHGQQRRKIVMLWL